MTIDPASVAASLVAALEARATQRTTKPERPGLVVRARQGESGRRTLGEDLARVTETLDVENPASYARARRQVVSLLLQQQLGVSMRELPEWSSLVDRVANAISADPAVDSRMAAWLRNLKRQRPIDGS